MKETFDNKLVPSRCYYYLLDFNDVTDKKYILEVNPESEGRLMLLTYDEFWMLFDIATKLEKEMTESFG
jgi:hypothetical protein